VPRPTSLCFGGPRLDRLYITSAATDLDKPALAAAPLSGSLFAYDPGVGGLPFSAFGR
jgi:sugar lactone lactonase YvrE